MTPTDELLELVHGPASPPLDRGGFLLAAHRRPDLDIDAQLERLDRLAAAVRGAPTLDSISLHLFTSEGFTGDRDDYYDPANSMLDLVLDRRRGIPITLSVVMLEVGRRLHVPLRGVGMPGHFLVKDAVFDDLYVDPYHGGARLTGDQCRRFFRSLHGPTARFDPSMLAPVDELEILTRMLRNLTGVYARRGDRHGLVWVTRLASAWPGAGRAEALAHARALAEVGQHLAAARHLEQRSTELGDEGLARAAAAHRARLN